LDISSIILGVLILSIYGIHYSTIGQMIYLGEIAAWSLIGV